MHTYAQAYTCTRTHTYTHTHTHTYTHTHTLTHYALQCVYKDSAYHFIARNLLIKDCFTSFEKKHIFKISNDHPSTIVNMLTKNISDKSEDYWVSIHTCMRRHLFSTAV